MSTLIYPDEPIPELPEQPTPAEVVELDNGTKVERFGLQRPTRRDVERVNAPVSGGLGVKFIVLDRYRAHRVTIDENNRRRCEKIDDLWGDYEVHGANHPSVYSTWRMAKSQALGCNRRVKVPEHIGPRPGAILLFDLGAMPIVTSEDDVRVVLARPRPESIEGVSELEVAERMIQAWAIYARSLGA